MVLLIGLVLYSKNRNHWKKSLGVYWLINLVVMGTLMYGGVFGMPVVETSQWSGLPLTFMLALFGMVAAYPIGVLLALGRQSRMPTIKTLCVVYIEMIRGVPLISLLFMSSVMFPLFLPEGVTIDKVLRAQVAIILFTAAYIAEVVRGGLQAMERGQFEAADSLGLTYNQTMRLVILPQALRVIIPPMISQYLNLTKNSSLAIAVGYMDITGTLGGITLNQTGREMESLMILMAIYLTISLSISTVMNQYNERVKLRER